MRTCPVKKTSIILTLSLFVAACHQPLTNPEKADPIYNEMKKQRDKADTDLNQSEKDLEKAKAALDQAPIRTGQRQDALEDYFTLKHAEQKQIELYRYLSLKLQQQKVLDKTDYEASRVDKKPWPDPKAFETYQLEQKLASAPREWSPDNREKARHPASETKKTESEEGGE